MHVDFAGPFQGMMFLLAVDAHSKWPEVFAMQSTTADKMIEVLRQLFAGCHGQWSTVDRRRVCLFSERKECETQSYHSVPPRIEWACRAVCTVVQAGPASKSE